VIAAVLVTVVVLGGGYVWLRNSKLVAIRTVTVNGLAGPDVSQIETKLTDTAKSMTTLNLNVTRLRTAVAGYKFVHSLSAQSYFPNGLVIQVDEQVPIAVAAEQGKEIVVDARGLLLVNEVAPFPLPVLLDAGQPDDGAVTDSGALDALNVLGQAPYQLIRHVASATWNADHGVVLQLRNGPKLYFGPTVEIAQKWLAAIAVLGAHTAAGAAYIDLSDPSRPAPGFTTSGPG
jgi:cell division protein FtsQ